MTKFDRFGGIDWSGARGRHMPGLAVAVLGAKDPTPRLVTPTSEGLADQPLWSRPLIRDWLSAQTRIKSGRTLVGIDAALSLPFVDENAFLPGLPGKGFPTSALDLWAAVEDAAKNDDALYARAFVDAYAEHFLMPGAKGAQFKPRLRLSEQQSNADGNTNGRMESVFHLIGPSQVGLGAFSAIRLLNSLQKYDGVCIWPFDDIKPDSTLVCTEVFATYFARLGGMNGKIKDVGTLKFVLSKLGYYPDDCLIEINDHQADAMIMAAGLKVIADDIRYWNPGGLTDKVRETEGWVFGVL